MSNSSIFGPNAWLIDEQFQQYSKDPNSVDKEWRDYFEANGAPNNGASTPAAASADKSAKKSAPVKPAAKSAAPGGTPAAKPAKVAEKPGKDFSSKKKTLNPRSIALAKPRGRRASAQGMFKAIAKNMDESLEVPTATTVRDVPVKLMWKTAQ